MVAPLKELLHHTMKSSLSLKGNNWWIIPVKLPINTKGDFYPKRKNITFLTLLIYAARFFKIMS